MTLVPVRKLAGLAGLPKDRTALTAWLTRHGIATHQVDNRSTLTLSDLPDAVRLAYVSREIETAGLIGGTYDEAAHTAFTEMPPKMRAEAERKAEIARLLVSADALLSWLQKVALVQERFGVVGTSQPSLMRILRAVKGVDPINFAPALLCGYRIDGAPRTAISDAAWSFFMTTIRDAGPRFPIKQAWRDARDLKAKMGWDWPSFPTINRRWNDLTEDQRLNARHGHEATVKALAMPAMRDKTSIAPLEWVSLDGRTKDFWAHSGDGKARRYTFLALVDSATNFILDWEIAESENARSTVRLIKRTCETYGTFDRLYTDNGSAFAGHIVAGGAVHRFRNSRKKVEGVKPLGICHHLDIRIHFALPGNGQAKTAERAFASLSQVIDERPEFNGAHAGNKPGAAPSASVKPIHLDQVKDVLHREVHRHNNEIGRRGQGMNGRSYRQAFEAGYALRVRRQPTARQIYLAALIYTPVKVDRWGRVQVDNWTYGQPETQQDLRPYHKTGQAILLGRDPDDFSAPALAWNEDNILICEGIMSVKRGEHDSVDRVRDSTRNRKAARVASRTAEAKNNYMADAEFAAAMAAIPAEEPFMPIPHVPVVAGQFGGTLKQTQKAMAVDTTEVNMPEYRKRMDALLDDITSGRKPKLA